MSDYELMNQYIATPERLREESPVEEAPNIQREATPEQKQPEVSKKEENFRTLERERNEERKRREAAEQRARELEYQLNTRQQQRYEQPEPTKHYSMAEDEEDFEIDDDSYVEGKQVKKLLTKVSKRLKMAEEQFKLESQRAAIQNAERALLSEFNDFKTVVTADNLERLKYEKPSLYRSVMATPDVYDQGYAAYEALKRYATSEPVYDPVDEKLAENNKRPRSGATAGPQVSESPLSRIGDYDRRVLSEDDKERIRRQVAQAKMYR